MKPCRRFRKQIALHAAAALDSTESVLLEVHLRQCEGCRQYFEVLSALCAEHQKASDALREASFSEEFHDKLLRSIRIEQKSPVSAAAIYPLRRIPGLAWSMAALAGIAIAIFSIWVKAPKFKQSVSPLANQAAASNSNRPPNLMTFRLAANRSLDELDKLLTQTSDQRRRASRISYDAGTRIVDSDLQ